MLREDASPFGSIPTFDRLLDALDEWREPALYSQLFNHARIIDFKEGSIIVNLEERAQPDLVEKLKRLLKEKTGKPWTLTVSKEDGHPTRAEVEAQKKAQQLAKVSEGPLVKTVLESFPGSKIETINER